MMNLHQYVTKIINYKVDWNELSVPKSSRQYIMFDRKNST